ncbi:hypothetical protein HFN51_04430 [Rhizobium leguminosarum]|nr:hypothetical protein [Rhizobium leguminosarum]
MFRGTLIRSGDNAKTIKGDGVYETAIMYLAPYNLAGANVCPMAEQAGCIAGCLNTAGRGRFDSVQQARINKTKRYLASRTDFMAELANDLERFVAYCERRGVKPVVRLNGTSDIQWEVAHYANRGVLRACVFDLFPEIQFYDYTKVYKRLYRDLPANYRLVLSYSEASPSYADAIIATAKDTGANVAVVYRSKELRDGLMVSGDRLEGAERITIRPVIDGDQDDMRFLEPTGVIVGLYAKGAAKQDRSGFVIG